MQRRKASKQAARKWHFKKCVSAVAHGAQILKGYLNLRINATKNLY